MSSSDTPDAVVTPDPVIAPDAVVAPDTCPNCAAALAGAYCSTCGQRRLRGRLRVRDVVSDWFAKFFDLEHGLLGTIVGLTVRPTRVLREYVEGRRTRYASPVRYYMTWFLVWAIVWDAQTVDASFLEMYDVPEGERAALAAKLHIAIRAMDFPFLALIAVLFRFLFRKARFNYAEHLSSALYVFGHGLIANAAYTALDRDDHHGWLGYATQAMTTVWAGCVVGRLHAATVGPVGGPVRGVFAGVLAAVVITACYGLGTFVYLALAYGLR